MQGASLQDWYLPGTRSSRSVRSLLDVEPEGSNLKQPRTSPPGPVCFHIRCHVASSSTFHSLCSSAISLSPSLLGLIQYPRLFMSNLSTFFPGLPLSIPILCPFESMSISHWCPLVLLRLAGACLVMQPGGIFWPW